MRLYFCLFLFIPVACIFFACNKEEGFGGSSSIEGYVYEVRHNDDNFSFQTDIFPSLDRDVFIEFGDDLNIGQRIRSGRDGYFRFDYLRKGSYTVYALSEFADGHKEAVTRKVEVNSKLHSADTVFIHTGKACGTAMIRGSVMVRFFSKGQLVYDDHGISLFPAIETRVFIKNKGEDTAFNDVRVGDKGVFVFQKVQPGKTYEIFVSTQIQIGEIYKHILEPVYKEIEVKTPYQIYDLGEFKIDINN